VAIISTNVVTAKVSTKTGGKPQQVSVTLPSGTVLQNSALKLALLQDIDTTALTDGALLQYRADDQNFVARTTLADALLIGNNASTGGTIKFNEGTDNGSNFVALKAPNSVASNITFTLPGLDGTSGQVLTTNGSGILSFSTVSSDLIISDDSSSTATISLLTDTLRIAGGTGITSSISGDTVTLDIDNTVATLTGSQTLTNKTLTTPVISTISNSGTLTLPTSTDTLIGRATTDTLTNKTISFTNNTISATSAQLATAISDETGSGALVFANSPTLVTPNLGTPSSLTLTNATDLPISGLTSSTSTALGVGTLELGHASDTTLSRNSAGVLAVEGVVVPTISSTNTLTNKSISGSTNTITNIGNSSITNPNIKFVDDTSTVSTIDLGQTLKISGGTGLTSSISGDNITINLDNTAVTPNTYGSSTAIPVLIIDQQGRITSASTQNISTTLSISDDTSTLASINLGSDTLKISGTSNEIETSISGDTITIGLPNNVTISGNLTVNGTTTSVNTTNTTITDKLLELATGRTGSATGDAGIIIERGDDNNIFIGYDESADVVTFASGTFTGSSTGDLSLTESNIKAANITSTGNLDIAGSSTLRGSITLGVNSGDSTEDTITVNARFISNLEPLTTLTHDLGSPERRWRDIYLSGNTIDLNGATISGDGTGAITISATGATLPAGSLVGTQAISTADAATGISTRSVSLFTQASGLGTAAATFIFKTGNEVGTLVFTGFTMDNGQSVTDFNSGGALFTF